MHKDQKELLRTTLWVTIGLVIGAVMMLAFQNWTGQNEQTAQKAAPAGTVEAQSVPTQQAEPPSAVPQSAVPEGAKPTVAAAKMQPCPAPLSSALTVLNQGLPYVQDSQTVILQPGSSYSETGSGYPIITGGRAVDSPSVIIPQSTTVIYGPVDDLPGQVIGRNGLLANPAVDPSSSHGLAYNRRSY